MQSKNNFGETNGLRRNTPTYKTLCTYVCTAHTVESYKISEDVVKKIQFCIIPTNLTSFAGF